MSHTIAVIPSLDPDEKFARVIADIKNSGFEEIIVVNDGSRPETLKYFETDVPEVTMLTHSVNRGKGRALKTAFEYILANCPDCKVAVTIDGDGQHAGSDAARIAENAENSGNVTLGARNFDLPHIPKKSRVGNKVTRKAIKLLFGLEISDTQTGLRAFPRSVLPLMTAIPGERFEYETEMLLRLHREKLAIDELPISTIYIDDNKTSHYRAVLDSLLILSVTVKFLAFMLSSIAATIVDNAAFYVFLHLFSGFAGAYTTTVAFTAARIISSAFNYALNRKTIFRSSTSVGSTVKKYYLLALCQFLISNVALNAIVNPLDLSAGVITAIKLVIDLLLFLLGYQLQKRWVFPE
ncbi:MAG: bifunctional glycosyltransferase family 2/GtrA family protein [Oscillospiraceae bacterium]|jgi:glycosyltransferase involved in cell wall biosynthesis|nr:bifunctional glycosyltransferase family 2/GtrA family protein [Oscillospiraceae bacterium]